MFIRKNIGVRNCSGILFLGENKMIKLENLKNNPNFELLLEMFLANVHFQKSLIESDRLVQILNVSCEKRKRKEEEEREKEKEQIKREQAHERYSRDNYIDVEI